MDPDKEIEVDVSPYLRVYKSGRVERLIGTAVVPAGVDPCTGVASKDVVVNPETGVAARLYLPPGVPAGSKLPVVVYYHGGAFMVESAFSPTYHRYLNSLASEARAVAVSVNYRLAPEHVLPAAYDDAWDALRWVASHTEGVVGGSNEPWLLEHGDPRRVFVAGDSAGGNIAHNVALRLAGEGLPNGNGIRGLALIQPSFWGEKPMGGESAGAAEKVRKRWGVVCPGSAGLDDARLNPLGEGAGRLGGLPCGRVVVAVAEKDTLRERGRGYYEGLRRSGWEGEAELVESEGEEHVFHLNKPDGEKAQSLMRALVALFNSP